MTLKIVPLVDFTPAEKDWLDVLFSRFDSVEWHPYQSDLVVEDNTLFVFADLYGLNLSESVLNQVANAKGVGLLHLGEEYLRSALTEYAAFSYIIRNFPFVGSQSDGVKSIPIGYTRNLGPGSRKRASDRKYTWMFAGGWKADRHVMGKRFQSWSGGLFDMPEDPRDGISRQAYLDGMADAAFAPCPAGNLVLETARPYEALYFGAIPLLPKRRGSDVFKEVLGDHPLPVFDHWHEARSFAEKVHSDPIGLDALQNECLTWWDESQVRWGDELVQFVKAGQAGAFEAALKDDFSAPVPTWTRVKALVVQQNFAQVQTRVSYRLMQYLRKLTGQKAKQQEWSFGVTQTDAKPKQD